MEPPGTQHPRRHLPLPPLFFLACLIAGGVLQLYWPLDFVLESKWPRVGAAAIFAAIALSLFGSGLLRMQRAGTTHEPGGTPSALVTNGPFRWSRNPLYVGLVCLLAGFAALLNSVWLVLAVPVLWLLLNTFVIPREEAILQRLFGDEYSRYRGRVRRWL